MPAELRFIGKLLPNHLPSPELLDRFGFGKGLCYVLPTELVELLKRHAAGVLPAKTLTDEKRLAAHADELQCVAFRDGRPLHYPRLQLAVEAVDQQLLRKAGAADPAFAAKKADEFLAHVHQYSQAYVGWLCQQAGFWEEIDSLVREHEQFFGGHGLPNPVFSKPSEASDVPPDDLTPVQQFAALCERWRLQNFVTLDLPQPVEPQLTSYTFYAHSAPRGAVAPHLPDIFPIEAKGMLADSLEASRSSISSPHLDEWKDLISSSSRGKTQIKRYARDFLLQHHWRVLTQRFPSQLQRKRELLYVVFAQFFDVSESQIKRRVGAMDELLERPLSQLL